MWTDSRPTGLNSGDVNCGRQPRCVDLARDDHLVALLKPALDESPTEPDRLRAAGVVGQLRHHPLRSPAEAGLDAHGVDTVTRADCFSSGTSSPSGRSSLKSS